MPTGWFLLVAITHAWPWRTSRKTVIGAGSSITDVGGEELNGRRCAAIFGVVLVVMRTRSPLGH